jgi:hypothetical protein
MENQNDILDINIFNKDVFTTLYFACEGNLNEQI